eukprot:NODE_2969_length_1304_cov_371.372566_g2820_i0.p1 GENE.NODE_2969_length_1304_cov_371.372566_g2820_i0~~NODE_2969_length_1304_cov_371.372566_g2820_i0.p1  ORF type:complete len:228 (-),score=63.62 NODE_2969_length_1304_cov_371.372566_g2820_i0:144-827(-)
MTHQAFWIFILPATLLGASHIGLALVLVFAAKATTRSFSKLEYAMMFFSVVTAYLAMPLFFTMIWKYAVWIILVMMLVFLTAAARIRWLNILCIVMLLITLLYVFDPFHGNAFTTLSLDRFADGSDNIQTSGLLHSIARIPSTNYGACTDFYLGYFKYDPMLQDTERYDNPEVTTFGLCSRGWITAQLFFAGLAMIGILLQTVFASLGLFFRFHRDKGDDVVEYADN